MIKKKIARIALITIVSFCVLLLLLFFTVYLYARKNVDYSRDEMLFAAKQYSGASRLYYYNDEGLPEEYAVASLSDCKRIWYSYSEIPEVLKTAFISAEDRSFFDHGGIDVKRTLYAALNYIFKLRSEFGGSTITQQVIKNISGDNEHSAVRKINEILRAVHIEDIHSKEEIFEVYLNIVPMGEGICGVGLASQHYFGKEPKMLTTEEAATLVGITNAPARYDPYKNYSECLKKRNRVLYSMLDSGALGNDEYERLIKKEIVLAPKIDDGYAVDSWFTETVMVDVTADLAEKFGITENAARILLQSGGYSIYTTVDPSVQRELEEYFYHKDNFPSAVNDGLDYAMIITDSESGAVVGAVGSVGKKTANRVVNGVLIPRVPGSVLKPLALYAPIIDEKKAGWSTVFDDSPVSFYTDQNGNKRDYPRNSNGKYDGLITLADALMLSKNTVAARIYNELGKEKIFKLLTEHYGFDLCCQKKTDNGVLTDKALAPLALGQLTTGISLRTLTGAYGTFVSDGVYREPITYTLVKDSEGETVLEKCQDTRRVMGIDTARIMNQLLSRVTEGGTAKSITLDELYDTAGKTGTSGGDKDRLFIGYTPYYTAGIWCGYSNRSKEIGKTEKSHLAIWDDIMHTLHGYKADRGETLRSFSTLGLDYLPFCKDSGELFSDNCLHDPRGSRLDYGYFSDANRPRVACATHVLCLAFQDEIKSDGFLISLLDLPARDIPTEIEVADSIYSFTGNTDTLKKISGPLYMANETEIIIETDNKNKKR